MRRFVALALLSAACSHAPGRDMAVSKASVLPGTSVTARGAVVALYPGTLSVGDDLPGRLKAAGIDIGFAGRVSVVSLVPSVDTKVCEAQTHILGETRTLLPSVDRITLSRDLPMAQTRFAREAGLENIRFFSDYKDGAFGRSHGLMLKGRELLTRGVIVLDKDGKVRLIQLVPELGELPDMEAAFVLANSLAREP